MFFGSAGDFLLMVHAILFISSSTDQQAFSFQSLVSHLGGKMVQSLTTLRKHVLQAKTSLGQRHHICVRLSSQNNLYALCILAVALTLVKSENARKAYLSLQKFQSTRF